MSSTFGKIHHEKIKYPACEEEDCYCLNHWPDRSGGEEVWVLDNIEKNKTIRCEVAINNGDYESCSLCENWMIDFAFQLKKFEFGICYLCRDNIKLDHILIDFLKDEKNYKILFGQRYNLEEKTSKDFENIKKIPQNQKIIKELLKIIKLEYKKIEDKIMQQKNEKNEKKESLRVKRRRIIKSMIPSLKNLNDEEIDEYIPEKKIFCLRNVEIINNDIEVNEIFENPLLHENDINKVLKYFF